ncbi:phosphodiester glycosidase family protein [Candidatus Solirubrobacter pratensis]|uniref:phosphodiester glycosidase family protein n=1 Tax=Candidatus Solirubrobacter pratensis TaxID=1298857 RepID=UPI00041EC6D4|nr:phosphodiester glycosidase family protein [Candidatus Solirubrobacter pratensis]
MLEAVPRSRWLRATVAALAAALIAAPAAHAAADQLSLIDATEAVGPGISLHHQKFLDSSGWYDEQVLTVDLSNSAIKSDLLTAPHVAQGEALTSMAGRAGAAAGVNGDFFDIDSTQASLGGEIQNGSLIKSADFGGWAHVGVGKDGLGRLVDMTLQATANLNGTDTPVVTLNAASSGGVPAGSIIAYTSAWGSQTRGRSVAGVANVAEVLVQDGKVVQVNNTAGSGAIPDGAFYLVGRDAGAAAIKALKPGDPVTLTYGLKDAAAQQMQWAIGTNKPLIQNGVAVPQGDTSVAPRTAIGFKDGGKTMFLLITDGRQTQVTGTTLAQTAQMLLDLGADTGLNLDGGGSTTLVARPLGGTSATLRNTPSDGTERADPTGIGLFVSPGDGKVDSLVVNPSGDDARVFPGLHRTLMASGLDDHQVPVKADDVAWSASAGTAEGGDLHAPSDAKDGITVTATSGAVKQDTKVTVLHALRTLELSSSRLSYADATANLAQTLKVTGRDDQGYTAPIELQDMTLDYDHAVIRIDETAPGSLKLTPLQAGGTTLDVKVSDQEEKLPITIGVVQSNVYTFNHADEVSRWSLNGTSSANQKLGLSSDGYLTLTYKAERNSGISAKTGFQIQVPGSPLRVHLKLNSTQALQFSYISYRDAKGVTSGPLGSPIKAGDNDLVFSFPTTVAFPVTITASQAIETNVANQKDGVVTFKSIDADNSATVPSPPQDALEPDALFSPDGTTNGKDDWSFGTLSDIQFTAANPTLAKVGVAALERIRKTNPELIVLNGDVTDLGAADDMTLARQTLEQGGCRLIPLTSAIGSDDTPAPTAGKTPCYYVPGNHESYRASGQGDLAPFQAEFGQPYGTFDHDGTRFILLASSYGTLRGTSWAQMPMFQAALNDAETNPAVKNVMVFAHHPVDDPDVSDASQLGDRTEVALVEKMLSDFRAHSDKGVAMVGSHAQIADVHRIEGVPYTVLPSSGKDPYGTPDRGGFTGWLDWHVDKDASAGQQWLTADVRAFAQSITLNAPDALEVGESAQLDGSIVQPQGVTNGTRVVPLRYPMSVHWSGSDNLAIGGGIEAARAAGKDAYLDPLTRKVTALHSGEVTVRVTNDSMREYTGDASLAPIGTEKTIKTQVTHSSQDAPAGGDVPATLALTLGAPASFGAFTPGVEREYTASTTASVTSTAGDAALTASPAKLANGAFTLAQPVVITPEKTAWTGPATADAFSIGFKQSIGANDPLRTGDYSATVTFTLSTQHP